MAPQTVWFLTSDKYPFPDLEGSLRAQRTLLPQLGPVPARGHHRAGEILVPPTEPGDKPIILRPDDRPKKQSTRLLKAECPECGYTIRVSKKWADLGLPTCPIDRASLALDESGRGASNGGAST